MPVVDASYLRKIAASILESAGATPDHSRIVADALVAANLEGHDSHGVAHIPEYVGWIEEKLIDVGAELEVVEKSEAVLVVDGHWGWGQVIGRQVLEMAIQMASRLGAASVSARRCNHLGRAGDYPLLAARRGMAAIMFVNAHGGIKQVAPWGGRERRLATNPISIAIPRPSGDHIVMDIATAAVAEGKLGIMAKTHRPVPPGSIIDAEGRPTTNPADYFALPKGALLPAGGHKGYALGLLTDILAGAISGAGCSSPTINRPGNSFLATVIDIAHFRSRSAFDRDVDELLDYVKSSKPALGFSEILIPGEPERRERKRREKDGIPIDDETWREFTETARKYRVNLRQA